MSGLKVIGIGGGALPVVDPKQPLAASIMARYPFVDPDRESRIVQDVADMLHESLPASETERKVKRWIQLVLWDAERRRAWWFLDAVASRWLNVGDDVVDLRGHVKSVASVWAPEKISHMPLGQLLEKRAEQSARNAPNGGDVARYSLEAARRLHLWPAPAQRVPLIVLYRRPIHVAIVPDDWEEIILNGIIGRFGRHFDRDALTQDPQEFERRYESALRAEGNGHGGLERLESWIAVQATQAIASLANAGGSTELLVPMSVGGVGYQSLADGDYPLEVS